MQTVHGLGHYILCLGCVCFYWGVYGEEGKVCVCESVRVCHSVMHNVVRWVVCIGDRWCGRMVCRNMVGVLCTT